MSDRPNQPDERDPDAEDSATTSSSSPPLHRTHQHLDTDALSAFLDDRLAGEQREEAASHIAVCADCRRELRELRSTVDLLRGLPQYKPRRSFVLGGEYAHPVRTSRLARFLPLLPVFRAATVAVFVLLLGVGAADVLTEIGNTSDDNGNPTAQTSDNLNDTAMLPAETAPGNGGDGTGGGDQPAGGEQPGTKPTAPASLGGAGFAEDADTEVGRADEAVEADSAVDSAAESGGASNAETGADTQGGSGGSANDTARPEAADADTADGEAPPMAAVQQPEPAEESESLDEAPASDSIAADGESESAAGGAAAGESVSGAAAVAPATATVAPRPTEVATEPTVSMADTSATTGQNGSGGSDEGLSTWRLIEYTLAAVLVALALLVLSLQRLATRARKIGLLR